MAWEKDTPSRTSTPEHRAWRLVVLANCNYECQIKRNGCQGKATIGDHILNIKRGGAPFDPRNGQGACWWCHNLKTQEEALAGRLAWKRTPPKHPGLR